MDVLKSLMVVLLFSTGTVYGQYAENALGLRFSGNDEADGIGAEVSYQRALGQNNRAELNLGFKDSRWTDALKITGIYQWVYNIEGGLNWYTGPAVGAGLLDRSRIDRPNETHLYLMLGGDVGLEYIFDEVPLQLALDVRPEIFLGNPYDNIDVDVGLALRWQFR